MQRKIILFLFFVCYVFGVWGQQIVQRTISNANPNGMIKTLDASMEYLIYGYADTMNTQRGLITKIDSTGTQQWSMLYTDSLEINQVTSMAMLPSGNYVAVIISQTPGSGQTSIVKIDKLGDILETKSFFGIDQLGWRDIMIDNEGYIVACGGQFYAAGNWNYALMKLDTNLNVIWCKEIDYRYRDRFSSITLAPDGNYIVQGLSEYLGGPSDILVLKVDTAGNIMWAKQSGDFIPGSGMGNGIDGVRTGKLICNASGEIINGFSCYWYSNNFGTDAVLQKLDANGNEIIAHQFGNDWRGSEGIGAILGNTDTSLVLTTGLFFIKCDIDFNIIWRRISNWYISQIGSSIALFKNEQQGYNGVSGSIDHKTYFSMVDSLGTAGCGNPPIGAFFDQPITIGSIDVLPFLTDSLIQVNENITTFNVDSIVLSDSLVCNTATGYKSFGINGKKQFNVYPTLTDDYFTIEKSFNTDRTLTFFLFDINGKQLIKNTFFDINEVKVKVKEFDSGIYVLQLISGNNSEVFKIIKQ